MFWAVNGILFGRNCFNIKTVNVRKHNTIVYVHSLIVHCHFISFQTQITRFDEIIFFHVFFFSVRVVSARRDRQAPDMMWSVYFKDPYERWAGFKQTTPVVVEQPMTWKLGVIKAHTGTYYEFLFSVVETVLLLFFLWLLLSSIESKSCFYSVATKMIWRLSDLIVLSFFVLISDKISNFVR